jgi:hypothetical protein
MYIPNVNSILAAGLALTGMPELIKGRTFFPLPYLLSLSLPFFPRPSLYLIHSMLPMSRDGSFQGVAGMRHLYDGGLASFILSTGYGGLIDLLATSHFLLLLPASGPTAPSFLQPAIAQVMAEELT